MGLNGFFPKTKNDSIWLKAITQRSMDSASLPLFKNNVTLNTRIAGIGKTHTGTIDLLLFLGADPLGPTNFDNENALDHRRKASQPFDWKVISLFQKRDPIRINYLLNDDDFFFIALINGNLKEVKERLKKIDLIKKGPTFYNKVLSTAVYSGNVELVNFLKNFSTPFYALKWHYLFQIAIQSHNKNLIQTIISMHPNKKEAYSAYFRKTTGHITNFYKQLAELNQLLPLVKPEIKNKIYSFTDTSNTFLGEILIKYNPETNTFKPYWDFASLYSSLEKCDLCKDYEYFHYPNEPFFFEVNSEKPKTVTTEDTLISPDLNSWEPCGIDNDFPVYALIEYQDTLFISTKKDIKPFNSFVIHQNRLFGSSFSPNGTESVYEYTYNGWKRMSYGLFREPNSLKSKKNELFSISDTLNFADSSIQKTFRFDFDSYTWKDADMSYGLFREPDPFASKKNKLFSISDTLYFADSSIQKTFRFDFDSYTWKDADTSLIEFIDQKPTDLQDTLKSKTGVPLALKSNVNQLFQHKDKLFAATEVGLLSSDNQGKHWSYVNINDLSIPIKKPDYYTYYYAHFLLDSNDISIYNDTSVSMSNDGGFHWTSYRSRNKLYTDCLVSFNKKLWKTDQIECVCKNGEEIDEIYSSYDANKVYEYSFGDDVYKCSNNTYLSLDSGDSWKEIKCFKPFSPNIVYNFHQSHNNLYASTDRGVYINRNNCWLQLPIKGLKNKIITSLASSDKYLFALNSYGQIFKAKIPVKEWKLVSSKIKNTLFETSAILYHKNTLIAATDKGPLFSFDQGNTWVLHPGLPLKKKVESIAIVQNVLFAMINDTTKHYDIQSSIYRIDLP